MCICAHRTRQPTSTVAGHRVASAAPGTAIADVQRKCVSLLPSFRRRGTNITSGRGSPQLGGESLILALASRAGWTGNQAVQELLKAAALGEHLASMFELLLTTATSSLQRSAAHRTCPFSSALSCARRSLSMTMFRSRNSIGSWTNVSSCGINFFIVPSSTGASAVFTGT